MPGTRQDGEQLLTWCQCAEILRVTTTLPSNGINIECQS